MAIDINEWTQKLEGIDKDTLISWVHQISTGGYDRKQMEKYLMEKYFIHTTDNEQARRQAIKAFEAKWLLDHVTGEKIDPPAHDIQEKPDITEESEGPEDDYEPAESNIDEAIDDDDIDLDEVSDDDIFAPLDDALPYENPNLAELDIDNHEEDIEIQDKIVKTIIRPREPIRPPEFITKSIEKPEFDKLMAEHRAFLGMMKDNGDMLVEYAQKFDMVDHLPYAYMRDTLINNPIKDINKCKILLNTQNPSNPDSLIPGYIELGNAIEVARNVLSLGFYQGSLDNFTNIAEHYEKYIQRLIALIYLLEIYCESNQKGKPWIEMSIPKEHLSQTVTESFRGINDIIKNEVVAGVENMRNDLKGEMVDVAKAVNVNMGNFANQIDSVIEKVVKKVKTDIDSTNVEDIKHSSLTVLNIQRSTEHIGAGPYSIRAAMVSDLHNRLISENFKMDKILENRRYTISEMQKRFGYKVPNVIMTSVKMLAKHKLIIVHKDSTFSLPK